MNTFFRKKHWILGISIAIIGAVIFLLFTVEPSSGGTYVNSQYGFAIEFPAKWAGRYIVEEKTDSIVFYDRQAAIAYGEEEGELFTLYVCLEDSENKGTILGNAGNYKVSYIIATDSLQDSGNESLEKEYNNMLKETEEVLNQVVFTEKEIEACKEIQTSISRDVAEELLSCREQQKDQDLEKFVRMLPFGKVLESCSVQGNTVTLEYQAKAVEAYSGIDIGDISRRIAECVLGIFDQTKQVVINYNSECFLGYSEEILSEEMKQAILKQDLDSFYRLLIQGPKRGRVREYGEVEQTGLSSGETAIYELPDDSSEVKYSIPENAPVYLKFAAGEFFYVEWRYAEDYDYFGYVRMEDINLREVAEEQSRYGYSYEAELYSDPGRDSGHTYRGWFLICQEKNGWVEVSLPSGENAWLISEEVYRGLVPEIVKLSWEDLLTVYQEGVREAYRMAKEIHMKGESFSLADGFFENMPEKYQGKLIEALEKDTGLSYSAQRVESGVHFELKEKDTMYSMESVVEYLKVTSGTQYADMEILLNRKEDKWQISKSVITEVE